MHTENFSRGLFAKLVQFKTLSCEHLHVASVNQQAPNESVREDGKYEEKSALDVFGKTFN